MISKYDGDYLFSSCFCFGKIDGKYCVFDSLEDYEAYRDALQNQTLTATRNLMIDFNNSNTCSSVGIKIGKADIT